MTWQVHPVWSAQAGTVHKKLVWSKGLIDSVYEYTYYVVIMMIMFLQCQFNKMFCVSDHESSGRHGMIDYHHGTVHFYGVLLTLKVAITTLGILCTVLYKVACKL